MARKGFGQAIDSFDEIHPLLPDLEITVSADTYKSLLLLTEEKCENRSCRPTSGQSPYAESNDSSMFHRTI